ncbi:enoyl-CoA hydratase/isomerase family protein [Salinibacterium hongtaonis]|uniref:Enoyl-CoA hydratase/isomerase family protein n=1 Tax=Homoserinimonas hongtaonis TaxID=2079791 RepID=A0A2U1SZ54_9MICO|nr:enoyl-CoA hydratase/isomerase family protein [Salinibacterium hongtaonis]AWB89470.1 enoyl-CoA hydratase [Salinibacterium hongtaonis]PWB96910.1 enoyl-CoA hydratase/isomerase family protein [Salinibacterium hongtaonis]
MTDTTTPSPAIVLSVTDGIARVTLNRPSRLNAIDQESAERWRDAAHEIARRDDVVAVIFDAAGSAFCAGGDIHAMSGNGSYDGAAIAALADVIHEGHRVFREMPKPIVAAVQGAVAGGGLGFMLVADYIVASDSAFFASRYSAIGLTPDCGVSTLLPEAVGMRRALELTLSSRRLSAAEALDWGLVTEVVAPEELASRVDAVALSWRSGAAGAFGQAKRLMRASTQRSYQENLDDEARTIGASIETPDATRLIAAFTAPRS